MAQAEGEVSELKTALADLATFVRSGLQQVQTETNASIAKVHDQTSTNIAKLQETADRVLRSVQAVEEWQPEVNANLTALQSTVEGLGTRVSNLEASPSRVAPTTLVPGGHGVAQQHQGATSRTPSVHERTLANEGEVSELKTALADLATFVRSGLQQVQTETNASIAKVHDQTSTNIAKLQETADRVLRSVQAVEEWQPEVNANLTALQSTVEGLGTRVSNLEASPSRVAPTTLVPGGHGVAQQHQGATSRTPSVHERTLANEF
ncbi:hypothetical protein QYE76_008310 [Lolium multiflorum]|uniref:Uncharacterized protein n=1 Tax=Lolium multiflorum TaxID=4521 RepID=A0AAD8PMW5_LOLMU|nr:hypothetical protein QYE76_008310 [Lolium multiflorum]